MRPERPNQLGGLHGDATLSGGVVPSFALLEPVADPQSTAWLRASMVTFGERVASFLPGHFGAYARVVNPIENAGDDITVVRPTWRDLAVREGADLRDPLAFASLHSSLPPRAWVDEGTLSPALLDPFIEHLARATTTPRHCFFALWEGFGSTGIPATVAPTLALPGRAYHVFAGPVEGATTNFSHAHGFTQSANLWWPADQAWCVATEVDLPWTYISGASACIAALLADSRVDGVATTAAATW